MEKIKFWSIYLFILIFIQMLFIVIYNIPIYKIYCELNNFYFQNDYNNFGNNINIYSNSFNTYSDLLNINYIYKNINYFTINYNYNNYAFDNEINGVNLLSKIYDLILSNFYHEFLISNIFNYVQTSFYEENSKTNIIYIVYFNTSTTSINLVEFISLQNHIYVYPTETYLSFFRIYNPTNYFIKGVSIYLLSPFEISIFIYKIQCFCFDELAIYPFESVELPILFYIDPNINSYLNLELITFFQIQILYLFILNSFFI